MRRLVTLLLICGNCWAHPGESGAGSSGVKLFLGPQVTVSKLPPVLEYLLQRIQTINSHYVHEDLSRPPTWEKPVYAVAAVAAVAEPAQEAAVVEEESAPVSSDGNLFEIIDKGKDSKSSTEKLLELITSTKGANNESFVYITPKPIALIDV